MSKALDMSNNKEREKVMTIFDAVGPYDRDALRTRPSGRFITVEAFEDSANQEVGVFAESIIGKGMLTRAIHVSMHKDVIQEGQVDRPQRQTDLHLVNTSGVEGIYNGVVKDDFTMVPDMDFTLVTFTDEGVVEDELHLNSNEVELAMWWPNNETGVDVVFVPTGERVTWDALIKAGKNDEVDLQRAKFFIDKLHEIPIGFGSVEQIIRFFTSSLEMHPKEMLELSRVFGLNVFQIKSEELIDMAVQADKAFKRLSSLFRVGTPINEIVHGDEWMFYMVEANEGTPNYQLDDAFRQINEMRKDWEEELTIESLHNMNLLHHDGCVYVSPSYMAKMEKMIDARYKRLRFADIKRRGAKAKFRKALTYQLRATGALLIDQDGNKIGLEGHMKTHIMVASGAVARWMEEEDIAFFGTSESYKVDLAVRTEGLALLVQTKAPKFDIVQSVQFYTTFNGINQGAPYNTPLREALERRLDEIVNMGADELQEFADAMAGETDEDEDDKELGAIRKDFNELLATYGASDLPVIDSPAATFAVLNNLLQKFRFATLNRDKNIDMSNKGFGRHIAYPIPGVRLQVFPRSFMVAGGHWMPDIEDHEIFFYGMTEDIQVAVVSDEAWYRVYEVTGGPDLDDFWEAAVFIDQFGDLRIKLQRNPAMWGEVLTFYPHLESMDELFEQIIDPFEGRLPVINTDLLPTPVDEIETLTLAEAYDKFVAPATGRPRFDMLGEVEKIDEQKKLMRTYVQMIILAGVRLLNEAHLNGLTGDPHKHWKRMDTRMLAQEDPAKLRQYKRDLQEWNEIGRQMGERKPMKPRGVIEGLIASLIKDVNNKPDEDRYVDVHAMIDFSHGNPWPTIPGEERGKVRSYGPYAADILVNAATTQVQTRVAKLDEHGAPVLDDDGEVVTVLGKRYFEGGITTMRNMLEKRLEAAYRLVMERIYDDYGIKLDDNEPGNRYYKGGTAAIDGASTVTSQHRLRQMKWAKGFQKLFGDKQQWNVIRAHGEWVESRMDNTRIKVVGLEDTVLGQVALYTSVSQFLPAASMVRGLYTQLFRQATEGKNLDGPARTMASRKAWLTALEEVQIPMTSEDDVNKFVLALLYVLRATPNAARIRGRFNIDINLSEGYGKPVNVQAEQFLYSSILINWGSERKNLVLSAFEHMKALYAGVADPGEAREVEMVTYRGSDLLVDVFLFKPETELTCKVCGTSYPVPEGKFVERWRAFVNAGQTCKKCRS